MRVLKSITGHVIYNPAYTYKLQLEKTTLDEYTYNQHVPREKAKNRLEK